jgi:hypothetical protein
MTSPRRSQDWRRPSRASCRRPPSTPRITCRRDEVFKTPRRFLGWGWGDTVSARAPWVLLPLPRSQVLVARLDQVRALGLLPPKTTDAEFEDVSDQG